MSYTSLEHHIRNIMTAEDKESLYKKKVEEGAVGGGVNTDKFQGNEFKSIRTVTPHIKPPGDDDGHSQAPENVSRQRNIAKEKAGINRVNEDEQLDEYAKESPKTVTPVIKTATPIVKAGSKALAGRAAAAMLGPEAMAGELLAPVVASRYKEQHKGGMIPHPETPGVDAATSLERMKGFKVQPAKPAETRPKPVVEPPIVKPVPAAPIPKTEPAKAPEAPAVTPLTQPGPTHAPSATKAATDTMPGITNATKTDTKIDTKADTKADPISKAATAATTGASLLNIGGGSRRVSPSDTPYHKNAHVGVDTSRGRTKPHKKFSESVESGTEARKKVPNVGRPDTATSPKDTKSTLYKQGQIQTKIIDEGKKLAGIVKDAVNDKKQELGGQTKVEDRGKDIIIINPPVRHPKEGPEDYILPTR